MVWVSSPHALALRAGRRLSPCQWEDYPNSVTGSGWPNESQPRTSAGTTEKETLSSPSGIARLVERKSGAYHRKGRACPRRKVTKRKAKEVWESFLIPSWEHLNQAVPEDERTFQLHQPITSLSPFSLHDFSFWLLQLIYHECQQEFDTSQGPKKQTNKPWKETERKVKKERQRYRQHLSENVHGLLYASKPLVKLADKTMGCPCWHQDCWRRLIS